MKILHSDCGVGSENWGGEGGGGSTSLAQLMLPSRAGCEHIEPGTLCVLEEECLVAQHVGRDVLCI